MPMGRQTEPVGSKNALCAISFPRPEAICSFLVLTITSGSDNAGCRLASLPLRSALLRGLCALIAADDEKQPASQNRRANTASLKKFLPTARLCTRKLPPKIVP